MKTSLLILILLLCTIQTVWSQEGDGVVAFDLPIRNSLVFNRFAINPTFSFVRSQNRYITFTNKREWVQFENAPVTFLGSYSGRFAENIGAGVAAFQQNYGVLTTFGGLLNFAYNIALQSDSNLTFGLNVGAYSSGVNTGNVITNFDDPSLQNVPSNLLLTINPGINYGTEFLDFGISVQNLVLYNFESSELIEEDPQQAIQAHVMHTGYFNGYGILDNAKFSGILMSEFRSDETIISGIATLNTPKGIWAQLGYNTRFGLSGGLGLNITKNIALEYNIEKAMGDLNDFGISHEFTLAYRLSTRNNYDYNGDDEVTALFTKKRRKPSKVSKEELAGIRERAAERRAQRLAEEKAKETVEADAQRLAEQQAKEAAEAEAQRLAKQKAKEAAEAEAQRLAEQQAKEAAEAEAQRLAEQKAKEAAEAEAQRLAEQKAKEAAEAEAQRLAEQQAKEAAEAEAQRLAEQKAKEAAEAEAQRIAEQKAKEAAEAEAQRLAEQKAKEAAEAEAQRIADQKAKEAAEAEAQRLAEQQAKKAAEAEEVKEKALEEAITNPKDAIGKSILELTQATAISSDQQNKLLQEFKDIIEIKDKDLKDLKEENDLSDQGIAVTPKPFKSVTAENNKLNAIKSDLDEVIEERGKKIEELQTLYDERTRFETIELDEVTLFYKKKIKRLKEEQLKAKETRQQLDTKLEAIRIATEFEKRRRIKRAEYDNDKDRYEQDRAALETIKQTTSTGNSVLTSEDFDFGEDRSNNIQILKGIENVENGYYLIIAVHSEVSKRNDFVTKVVASGRSDVDFFFDVNTSKYYIYYDKFDTIEEANRAMEAKGNRPYNIKMSLVKIEN